MSSLYKNTWITFKDESEQFETLSYGRQCNPDVASTVEAELKREIWLRHPLYNRSCYAFAYNRDVPDEFLFLVTPGHEHDSIPDVPE